MDLRDLLWERAEPSLYLTKAEFLASLDGWTIEGVSLDHKLRWITVQRGPEFHFESVGETRPMPRRLIDEFLRKIIDRHGFALTKTPKSNERQHRFNRLYGFRVVGEDEFDTHFQIDRLRHA